MKNICLVRKKLPYSINIYSFTTTFVKFIYIFENGFLVSLFWEWPNYQPVIILPIISKLFENLSLCMDQFLLEIQCSFGEGYSAQHYLRGLVEKQNEQLKNGKAFNCLSYELIIAKL